MVGLPLSTHPPDGVPSGSPSCTVLGTEEGVPNSLVEAELDMWMGLLLSKSGWSWLVGGDGMSSIQMTGATWWLVQLSKVKGLK